MTDGQAGEYSERYAIVGNHSSIEKSLEKLIEILHRKGLLTVEQAGQYIYEKSVHNLVDALVGNNTITREDIDQQLRR